MKPKGTKLKEVGEFGLIARMKEKVARPDEQVLVGIGDDAAVVRTSPGQLLLLTTDVLVEGVHFDRRIENSWQVGWRAMVANVSDIAAMGGCPRHALVSICLPEKLSLEEVGAIYDGMRAVADEHHFGIVGGDTVSSPRDLVLSICLTGEVAEKDLVTRGGAQEGDLICVTGDLGGAHAGLAMLQWSKARSRDDVLPLPADEWSRVRERYLRPQARLPEARLLAQTGCLHAMIDVSDGLAGEVSHISQQSGVGAEIMEAKIPLGAQTRLVAEHLGASAEDFALRGGEDFELVFTISPDDAARLLGEVIGELGTPISIVGKILPAREGVVLISSGGARVALPPEGYRHF